MRTRVGSFLRTRAMQTNFIAYGNNGRFPTEPTQKNKVDRKLYIHRIRMTFAITTPISILLFSVGMFLVIDYINLNRDLYLLGTFFVALGVSGIIISFGTGLSFCCSLQTNSDSVSYTQKSADNLKQFPYPRQPPISGPRRVSRLPDDSAENNYPTLVVNLQPESVMPVAPSAPPYTQPPPYDEVTEKM